MEYLLCLGNTRNFMTTASDISADSLFGYFAAPEVKTYRPEKQITRRDFGDAHMGEASINSIHVWNSNPLKGSPQTMMIIEVKGAQKVDRENDGNPLNLTVEADGTLSTHRRSESGHANIISPSLFNGNTYQYALTEKNIEEVGIRGGFRGFLTKLNAPEAVKVEVLRSIEQAQAALVAR